MSEGKCEASNLGTVLTTPGGLREPWRGDLGWGGCLAPAGGSRPTLGLCCGPGASCEVGQAEASFAVQGQGQKPPLQGAPPLDPSSNQGPGTSLERSSLEPTGAGRRVISLCPPGASLGPGTEVLPVENSQSPPRMDCMFRKSSELPAQGV